MIRQAIRFGFVGILSTAIHIIGGGLMIHAGINPLLANPIAFMIAFGASFVGHFAYTFKGNAANWMRAFLRFLTVALLGFLINQSVLLSLLALNLVHAFACLILSTSAAAMVSFALSRSWAFSERTKPWADACRCLGDTKPKI